MSGKSLAFMDGKRVPPSFAMGASSPADMGVSERRSILV